MPTENHNASYDEYTGSHFLRTAQYQEGNWIIRGSLIQIKGG
jgi:hypothetical protein